jgi:hypothetical protein
MEAALPDYARALLSRYQAARYRFLLDSWGDGGAFIGFDMKQQIWSFVRRCTGAGARGRNAASYSSSGDICHFTI